MKIILAILVIITALALGGFFWYSQAIAPADPANHAKVPFVVVKNQSAYSVVEKLASKGLIKSALVGKIYLKLSGLGTKIQAGAYTIAPDVAMQTILFSLTSGPSDIWVTIPEGFRREQIAERFFSKLNGPDAQFDSLEFIAKTATIEGRLFPDTYLIPTSANADLVISQMLANFSKKGGTVAQNELILASLIEREAKTDSERPIIAGIIQNRLKGGWPLQIDATVQYALGKNSDWWPKEIDTKMISIFNTYLREGLPPRPICNPGQASVRAAQNPQSTDYWFYIHDNQGQVHFAKTSNEHVANIDKYLRP